MAQPRQEKLGTPADVSAVVTPWVISSVALSSAVSIVCAIAARAPHSRATQDQHNRADGGSTNTVPARTKRHFPVRGGTAGNMEMSCHRRSLPSSGRLSAVGVPWKACNYRPSCKRTVSGSNPLTGSKSS
jgi:hypothetical protein